MSGAPLARALRELTGKQEFREAVDDRPEADHQRHQCRVRHRIGRAEIRADRGHRHRERGVARRNQFRIVAFERVRPEDQPEIGRVLDGEGDIAAPDRGEVLERPRRRFSSEGLRRVGEAAKADGGERGEERPDVLEVMRRRGMGNTRRGGRSRAA